MRVFANKHYGGSLNDVEWDFLTRNPTLTRKSPVTAARPLPRYGAIEERARSRPCSRQLHHYWGHDLAPSLGTSDHQQIADAPF